MRKLKAGFMFIELLVVLVIIMFLASKVINTYFKKPVLNKEAQKLSSEAGIDTKNYQTIIDTTKDKLKDIQTQYNKDLDDLNNIK